MSETLVSCDGLAELALPSDARVAVLVLLKDGQIQFVTWGRDAKDKSEAHNLKEWIKEDLFNGDVPEATVHESFILDAARNKESLDRLRAAVDTFFGLLKQRVIAASILAGPELDELRRLCS